MGWRHAHAHAHGLPAWRRPRAHTARSHVRAHTARSHVRAHTPRARAPRATPPPRTHSARAPPARPPIRSTAKSARHLSMWRRVPSAAKGSTHSSYRGAAVPTLGCRFFSSSATPATTAHGHCMRAHRPRPHPAWIGTSPTPHPTFRAQTQTPDPDPRPSPRGASRLRAQVKSRMLSQLLTLASITPYDREMHRLEKKRRDKLRYERLARGEPAAKQVYRQRAADGGLAMSVEAQRAVAEMDAEEAKAGQFRRIFPTAGGHAHRHVFAVERPLNTLLVDVLRQRQADELSSQDTDLDAIAADPSLPPEPPAELARDATEEPPHARGSKGPMSEGLAALPPRHKSAEPAALTAPPDPAPPVAAQPPAPAAPPAAPATSSVVLPPPAQSDPARTAPEPVASSQPQPPPQPPMPQQPPAPSTSAPPSRPGSSSSLHGDLRANSANVRISVQDHEGSWAAPASPGVDGVDVATAILNASRPSSGLSTASLGSRGTGGAGECKLAYRADAPGVRTGITPYSTAVAYGSSGRAPDSWSPGSHGGREGGASKEDAAAQVANFGQVLGNGVSVGGTGRRGGVFTESQAQMLLVEYLRRIRRSREGAKAAGPTDPVVDGAARRRLVTIEHALRFEVTRFDATRAAIREPGAPLPGSAQQTELSDDVEALGANKPRDGDETAAQPPAAENGSSAPPLNDIDRLARGQLPLSGVNGQAASPGGKGGAAAGWSKATPSFAAATIASSASVSEGTSPSGIADKLLRFMQLTMAPVAGARAPARARDRTVSASLLTETGHVRGPFSQSPRSVYGSGASSRRSTVTPRPVSTFASAVVSASDTQLVHAMAHFAATVQRAPTDSEPDATPTNGRAVATPLSKHSASKDMASKGALAGGGEASSLLMLAVLAAISGDFAEVPSLPTGVHPAKWLKELQREMRDAPSQQLPHARALSGQRQASGAMPPSVQPMQRAVSAMSARKLSRGGIDYQAAVGSGAGLPQVPDRRPMTTSRPVRSLRG